MKTITLLSITALLALSCDQKKNNTTASDQDSSQTTVSCSTADQGSLQFLDTLSQGTFNTLKTGWAESDHTLVQPQGPVQYFTVPFIDIKELATLTDVDSVRVYLGKGPTSPKDNGFRLMMVPVCASTDSPNYDVILDYTNVCPPACNNN